MNAKESHMKAIGLNGVEEAYRVLNREAESTYDDIIRAARACQAAAEDLNRLAGYMLWRKEQELEAKSRAPVLPIGRYNPGQMNGHTPDTKA